MKQTTLARFFGESKGRRSAKRSAVVVRPSPLLSLLLLLLLRR
jgi:hypothetical protein